MKLMRLDYRLQDYRLAGMASITDYDYRRLRLPITITNDYRLRFAAIRLAITISRGPLINTPVGRTLSLHLDASVVSWNACWSLTWTLQAHRGRHPGIWLGRLRCLLGCTLASHLQDSGASWETLWHLTWTLQLLLGTRSGTSLGHFGCILADTLAPHLGASGVSWGTL